jgi:exonuclease SbcC
VRITEFHITRYGPVRYREPFTLSDFTLFWGKNERGKTLTIDALVKLLLGKEARRFENIGRVDEPPSGHVMVAVDGRNVKLTGKETLTSVCDLSEAECRNVFIIRASDLSIGKENKLTEKEKEADFYAAVTDRLTGLKTEQIAGIKKALKNIGKLTPKGDDIRDTQAEPVKSRLKRAAALIETIETLEESIEREHFDEMEEMLIAHGEEKLHVEHEIEGYESARKRELFEKGQAAYNQLTASLMKLAELEKITEEDERTWSDTERDVAGFIESMGRVNDSLLSLRKRREDITQQLTIKQRDLALLSERKKRLDDELIPELKNYEIKSGDAARRSGSRWFYTVWGLSSAVVLGGCLFGLAAGPSTVWYILSALSGASLLLALLYLFFSVREQAWLAGMYRRIGVAASRYNLAAPNIEGIFAKIQDFSDGYRRAEGELNRLSATRDACDDEIAKTTEREIPELEKKIAEAQRVIETIRVRTGFDTSADLRKALRGKREFEEIRGRQATLLRSLFGDRNLSLREYLPVWRSDIDSLSVFKDARSDLAYDDTAVSALKVKRAQAVETIDVVNNALSQFRKELSAVEREADGIFAETTEPTLVETSVDLTEVRKRLESLIVGIEADRDDSRVALAVFDNIEAEERRQVSQLFGEDSGVSGYFSTITGGFYDAVSFDPAAGVVSVRNRDGEILPADKLSSGAYDQLYLSIRLALGRRIAPDGAGFFIMDDPFIRSDPDRLAVQMKMLAGVAAEGWQVVYFSSKGEIKDALAKEIKKGAVTLIEI